MTNFRIAKIKPHEIDETGIVTFTDGTNTGLHATQEICEAYGYTYDNRSGTCTLNQQFQASLGRAFNKQTNKVMGTSNVVETGVSNGLLNGDFNKVGGRSRNPFITGTENEINANVQNAAVFGVNGTAKSQSEFVIGGGLNTGQAYDCTATVGGTAGTLYTDRQTSIMKLSGVTCSDVAVNLSINGDNRNFINVRNNCIIAYEVHLIRLELIGSLLPGDYTYMRGNGSVHIDDAYDMTFTTLTLTSLSKGGDYGSAEMIDNSAGDVKSMSLQVTDRLDIINQWSATIYLHEVVSNKITF
jgi:hypothetical protein